MNDLPPPAVPASFRFKYRTSLLSAIAVMLVLNTWVSIMLMRDRGGPEGAALVLFLLLPFVLGGMLMVHAKSRLVIDEARIRRVWLGIPLQNIAWSEVALVRVFGRRGLYRGKYFHILTRGPRWLPRVARKRIWFDENCTDLEGLIDALNYYLARHNIRVDNSYGSYKTDSHQI